jgi:hypothetical protein
MSETLLAYVLIFSGILLASGLTLWRGYASAIPLLLLEPLVCGLFMAMGFGAASYLTCSPSFQASEWLLSTRMQQLGVPIEGNVGMFTLGLLVGLALAAWPRMRAKYDHAMGVTKAAPAKKVIASRVRNVTTSRIERGGWLQD